MDSKASDGRKTSKKDKQAIAARTRTVSLDDIHTEDNTYRITTHNRLEDLSVAIQSFGLMHPPVLIENTPGYTVVCGFRRIAACRQLGWQAIAVKIYPAGENRFNIAQLAIADNSLQRPLNLIETSRALNLLAASSPDKQQLKKAARALGLPIHPSAASKIQSLCRLPIAVQDGILSDTINLSMALELGKLDAADAATLVALFMQLKLGLNRQRELLLLVTEIAKRDSISIAQLLAEKTMQDILRNTEIDRAVQRRRIRSVLRQRRYPAISKAKSDYQKRVRQLKLGKHIQLIPPRDFEGSTYAMTLHFKNRQELRELKVKLEKILEHPAIGKILER